MNIFDENLVLHYAYLWIIILIEFSIELIVLEIKLQEWL